MDRTSHWPIYDVVSVELIEIVAKTVKEATTETVVSKESKGGRWCTFQRREFRKSQGKIIGGYYEK